MIVPLQTYLESYKDRIDRGAHLAKLKMVADQTDDPILKQIVQPVIVSLEGDP